MHRLAMAVPTRKIQFIDTSEPIQMGCVTKVRLVLLATDDALQTLCGGVGRRELHDNGCS
jgi:hypothetical protein